jgi:hypothetical protein
MTAELRAALADLGEEARQYADPDAAIAGAGRRRTGRMVAVVAAVAVLAVVVGVVGAVSPDSDDVPLGGDGYPATLSSEVVPLGRAPLGKAAFLYLRCPQRTLDCPPEIVLSDGRRYSIPGDESGAVENLTLSPDGRFAGWQFPAERGYTLVDLRTGERWKVGGETDGYWAGALQWSADGQRLVLGEYSERGAPPRFLMAGPVPGRSRPLPALSTLRPPEYVSGVMATGELLMWDQLQDGPLPGLRLVDPETGQTRSLALSVAPGTTDLLRTGDHTVKVIVEPCGCAVTIVVNGDREQVTRAALLKVDLGTAQVTARIDLPYDPPQGVTLSRWTAHAQPPEGVVLTTTYVDGTQVQLLNDITGERQLVTRLPYGSAIVARGETMRPS